MEELATVIESKGNKASVKIIRHSACSKCTQKCELAESHEQDELVVEVDNQVGAVEGELVRLEIEEQHLVFAALIIYLLPLILMIAGYFVGDWIAMDLGIQTGQIAGIIGTLFFLFISFLLIKLVNPYLEKKTGFKPVMKKVV